jgi:hypothetical protein
MVIGSISPIVTFVLIDQCGQFERKDGERAVGICLINELCP